MITLFSIPKPFEDPHIDLIQRNALGSWKALGKTVRTIIMGNERGAAEAAREFGFESVPDVARNESGTPLLDSAFDIAERLTKEMLLMFSNADMIFLPDLIGILPALPAGDFLAVGRRTDLDVVEAVDLSDPAQASKLSGRAAKEGRLHSPAGMDYFIFRKGSFGSLPPLAVGRVGWDNWMMAEALRRRLPTIDLTSAVTAIHQNHGYSGANAGKGRKTNPEALKNMSFVPKSSLPYTIEDAGFVMDRRGVIKPNPRRHLRRAIRLLRI